MTETATPEAYTYPARPHPRGFGPLRHRADLRTLAVLVVISALLIFNWQQAEPLWWAVALAYLLNLSTVAIIHNHVHRPIWRVGWMNDLQDLWLTFCSGSSIFEWIPAHVGSHHAFRNRAGDYATTHEFGAANDLGGLVRYMRAALTGSKGEIRRYLERLRTCRPTRFRWCRAQIALMFGSHAGLALLDLEKALLYFFLPHLLTLIFLLMIGYVQHVHGDEEDDFNHARNFTGWGMNFLFFNNGYHTIHHLRPGLHWSELPRAHAGIAHRIDPRLDETSLLWYLVRVYLLAPVRPGLGTTSLRLERLERGDPLAGSRLVGDVGRLLATADVQGEHGQRPSRGRSHRRG